MENSALYTNSYSEVCDCKSKVCLTYNNFQKMLLFCTLPYGVPFGKSEETSLSIPACQCLDYSIAYASQICCCEYAILDLSVIAF